MRFLLDAQLPHQLAKLLNDAGHPAMHVAELGLIQASDSEIWNHANTFGLAIFTKDEDFAQRRAMVSSGPQIVWLRAGNLRRSSLIAWFPGVLPLILDALQRGDAVIEVR